MNPGVRSKCPVPSSAQPARRPRRDRDVDAAGRGREGAVAARRRAVGRGRERRRVLRGVQAHRPAPGLLDARQLGGGHAREGPGVDVGRGRRDRRRGRRRRGRGFGRGRGGGRRDLGARADQVAHDQLAEPLGADEEGLGQRDRADVVREAIAGLGVDEPRDQREPLRRARPVLDPPAQQDLGVDQVPGLDPGRRIDVLALLTAQLRQHRVAPAPLDDRERALGRRQQVGGEHVRHAVAQADELRVGAGERELLDAVGLARIGLAVTRVDVRARPRAGAASSSWRAAS